MRRPPISIGDLYGPYLHLRRDGTYLAAAALDGSTFSARFTPRSMVSSMVTAGIRDEVRRRSSAISVIFSRATSVSASRASPRLIAASATGAGTRAAQASCRTG